MPSTILVALLLAGCDTGTSPEEGDADADGWTTAEGDCDDDDPTVYPGSSEIPVDGIDQNCDGGDACFQDADGDGFGSPETVASANLSCDDHGESTVSTDCGDGDPAMHPGATEVVADERDQDCDGSETCYQDLDEDGFGSQKTVPSDDTDCRDEGESRFATDCDDEEPAVNPDAEEICNDLKDNDCDGWEGACDLEGEIPLAGADAKIIGEDAGDGAGWAVASGDMDGDGLDDVLVGAAQDTSGGAGAAYILHGPLSGTVDLGVADVRLLGEEIDSDAGAALAVGDLDADGSLDVVVGAPSHWKGDGEVPGTVYCLYGPLSGDVSLADADARLVEVPTGSGMGGSLTTGDVDGDGAADLIIGAYAFGHEWKGTQPGAVFLVYGSVFGEWNPAMADAVLEGEEGGDHAGDAVASGDLDADGVDDVLVGAPDAGSKYVSGIVYLALGPVSGTLALSSADAKIMGSSVAFFGAQLVAGDLDGDGVDDVLARAPAPGSAYLFLGPLEESQNESGADAVLTVDPGTNYYGSLAMGDVDGDGVLDVLIGDRSGDGSESWSGVVYLAYGPFSGAVDVSSGGAQFLGEMERDAAGCSVATGDVNGDGLDDVLIGASYEDEGGEDAGAAYLVYGRGF